MSGPAQTSERDRHSRVLCYINFASRKTAEFLQAEPFESKIIVPWHNIISASKGLSSASTG